MARIRTIKPEFPQSESMGRVSRDARLLFIQLWTLADDEGRGRGASKMLSSLLFPYDDDAPTLIDGWINELEAEGCVVRYQIEGNTLFQICNWTSHQKIDKPGKSKFPAPTGEISVQRAERDMELDLFGRLKDCREAFGGRILDVQRQVRIGSSYLDIVVSTDIGSFVLELKRDRLTTADVRQVSRYAEISGAIPVLIGAGLSPQFRPSDCADSGVAVLLWPEGEEITLAIGSAHVTERSITFSNVTERQPLDQGSRIKDQGNNKGDDYAAEFAEFWESYPRKDNKAAAYRAWKKLTKPCRLLAAADVASRVWGDAKFVPHAATYLNNRRWEDSPADTQSSSAVGYWK